MRINRVVALFLVVFTVTSMLLSCGKKKDDYKLNPGLVESETDKDDLDVDVSEGDETTENPSGTETTGETNSTTTKKQTSTTTKVLKPPGDTVEVNPNEIKLPKINVTNKTVTILSRHSAPPQRALDILKKEYGLNVEIRFEPVNQINNVLISLVKSGKSPDLFAQDFSPAFLSRGYIQEIGKDVVDFDSALWKGVKETNMFFTVDGKVCFIAPVFPKYLVCYYNKKMFTDAGLKTPIKLFNEGKWDWNAFANAAVKLTVDSNRDGTPEVYGYGFDEPELLLYTTGKHLVSYNPKGRAINNIKSPEIARYISWALQLSKKTKIYPSVSRTALPQGKVAMVIGHVWYGSGYGPQFKSGLIEFAPLPKDPNADKYYVAADASGYMIPEGAKNVPGAAAYLAVRRYLFAHPDYFKSWYDEMKNTYGWNDASTEMFRKQNEMTDDVLVNWMQFNLGQYWGDIFYRPIAEGIPWSTIAEEMAPKIDYQIQVYYEN